MTSFDIVPMIATLLPMYFGSLVGFALSNPTVKARFTAFLMLGLPSLLESIYISGRGLAHNMSCYFNQPVLIEGACRRDNYIMLDIMLLLMCANVTTSVSFGSRKRKHGLFSCRIISWKAIIYCFLFRAELFYVMMMFIMSIGYAWFLCSIDLLKDLYSRGDKAVIDCNKQFNRIVGLINQGDEISPKDYSQSKHKYREVKRIEHNVSKLQRDKAKAKKRLMLKIRNGYRAALINESLEYERVGRSTLNTLKRSFRTAYDVICGDEIDVDVERSMNRTIAAIVDSKQREAQLAQIVSVQMAYLTNLCVCTNWQQIAAATLQMFVSIAGNNISTKLVEFYRKVSTERYDDLSNEGLSDVLEQLNAHMLTASSLAVGLDTIPIYKNVANAFALAALLGIVSTEVTDRDSIIEAAYKAWVSTHVERHRSNNLFSLMMETLSFAVQFANGVVQGKAGEYFVPHEVMDRATKLLSLRVNYKNGTLEPLGYTYTQYYNEVTDTIKLLGIARKGMHPAAASNYDRVKRELYNVQCEMLTSTAFCQLRPPAPCVVLYGDSHVGKTALMYMIIERIGRLLDFPTDDEYLYYESKGDSFDSGLTASKTVIINDDAAAEKSDYIELSKGAALLRYVNAVPYMSVQADIDKKGVIPLNHKLAIMTTNVPDLQVQNCFEYPMAAFNRAIMIEVQVNKYFCIPGTNKIDPAKMTGELPDPAAHTFIPYTYVQVVGDNVSYGRKRSSGYAKKYLTEPMNTLEFFKYLDSRIMDFHDKGASYVKQIKAIRQIEICQECGNWKDREKLYCQCDKHLVNESLEQLIGDSAAVAMYIVTYLRYIPTYVYLPSIIPVVWRYFGENLITNWLVCSGAITIYATNQLIRVVTVTTLVLVWCCLYITTFMLIVISDDGLAWLLVHLLWWYITLGTLFVVKRHAARQLSQASVSDSVMRLGVTLAQMGMSIAAAYGISKLFYNMFDMAQRVFPNQGNIVPATKEDIALRNAEVNPWLPVKNIKLDRAGPVSNMSVSDVERIISNNVARAEFTSIRSTFISTNVFGVCANVILVPKHVLQDVDRNVSFRIIRHENCVGGTMNDVRISQVDDVHNDLCAVVITRASTFKDMRRFFLPKVFEGEACARMVSRELTGSTVVRSLRYKFEKQVENESAKLPGSIHVCDIPTNRGDCGSPVFLMDNPQMIVGFHCAGSNKAHPCAKAYSACFSVSLDMLEQSLARLKASTEQTYVGAPPMFVNEMLDDQYNTNNMPINDTYHERDCINFVSTELTLCAVEPIGSNPESRFQRYSDVQRSILSPYLEAQGLPNKWGPPKFNANRNHAETFQHMCAPIKSIPEEELAVAIEDYLQPILSEINRLGMVAEPLSMFTNLNGDPGKKYIRSLDRKTSAGLGLKSPKMLHFDAVESNGRTSYYLKDYVQEEFNRVEGMIMSGILPHHIYKSALKDEPTPVDKDKVRVFQVGPLTLVLLTRKWTLDILNHLFFIPTVTEMAQGINCLNDEWDQCAHFLLEKGVTCLEGDYSKYDLRFSGQALRCVAHILRRLSVAMGYTSQQADIVERIGLEISYKMFLFNGTVFNIDGVNPSGVPLTIAINGMFNSILHRICYYRIARGLGISPPPFKTHVNLLTVGDDSVCSTNVPWFNMVTVQKEMIALGMPYTDGRKNTITVPFFHFNEIKLCKRVWRFEKRVGKYVGPIDPDSLLKSIHCQMKSATLPLEIVVQNVDGALRGFARHEESVFQEYKTKIHNACVEAGIEHLIGALDLSYDDWWEIFKRDFADEVSSLSSDDSLMLSDDTQSD